MDYYLIKTRHGDHEVRKFFDQTTYYTWQKEISGYRPNINLIIYSDRPSKIARQPCCHYEVRFESTGRVRKEHYGTIDSILSIDLNEFWKKFLDLRYIKIPLFLDAVNKYYEDEWRSLRDKKDLKDLREKKENYVKTKAAAFWQRCSVCNGKQYKEVIFDEEGQPTSKFFPEIEIWDKNDWTTGISMNRPLTALPAQHILDYGRAFAGKKRNAIKFLEKIDVTPFLPLYISF